ncbi:MAG: 50S ribosomal protein L10 [candidate division Zixibacteria bacterium]|nr:50S ribosomal protein L10 [candidate division Zixibacteria bacterium]MBU1471440.1 50S ribosomal protein L10 [candidate division Zixibacteria bacterium]MBU2626795.1 50S ribosomal protein L10 [candidate division Zixibacteria bacterium]
MPKPEKIELVAKLKEQMEASNAVLLSDYAGLTVEQMNALRKSLRESSVKYLIAKNTLFKIAADSVGGQYAKLADHWTGPTAVAFSQGDPTIGVKLLYEFAKANKATQKPAFKVGLVDGTIFGQAELEQLAQLPSRDELLSRVVGVILSPMTALVGTLDSILRELVLTVDAIAEAKAQ